MTQNYSEQFVTPIRRRLESLRGAVDKDLAQLEEGLMDLTFRQVFDLAGGLDSAVTAYQTAMQPLYRTTRRARASPGNEGQSYYQRRRTREKEIESAALEAVQSQGYVVAASLASAGQYREATVQKVLDSLAGQQGWERRRDRETRSTRYAPRQSVEQKTAADAPSASSPGSTAQGA